jgi:hypothetical protein
MPLGSVIGERVTTPRGLIFEWTGQAWLLVHLPQMGDVRHVGVRVRP